MRHNPEVEILRQRGHAQMASSHCRIQPEGNASYFLARYLIIQPYRHLPWNKNLSTFVNVVTDRIMQDTGLDPNGGERLRYVHGLCQRAIHLPGPNRLYGLWHLFENHFQSLLFPAQPMITTDSLESFILQANIYLGSPNIENLVLDALLRHGPKSLSTFKPQKSLDRRQKSAPLLGSILEASIRAENSNLAALLIKYNVDMSREKPKHNLGGKTKKGKRLYDYYFWRLALAFRDLETLRLFLESTERRLSPAKLQKILLEAVCTSQPGALRLLLDHQIPKVNGCSMNDYFYKQRLEINILEACLEDAVIHGHPGVFRMLLESPYKL